MHKRTQHKNATLTPVVRQEMVSMVRSGSAYPYLSLAISSGLIPNLKREHASSQKTNIFHGTTSFLVYPTS